MEKRRIIFGISLLAICVVLAWTLSSLETNQGSVEKGDKIPDASFQSLEGKKHSFSALRGKVLVINFWATWCLPCREEMPSLNTLFRQMENQPVEFLAFSTDSGQEPVLDFMSQGKYPLPVYEDFDRRLAMQFGTYQFPETYLVDKQGVVREKVIGAANWAAPEMVNLLRSLAAE